MPQALEMGLPATTGAEDADRSLTLSAAEERDGASNLEERGCC